ncbi:PHP domain-containing protein [Natroniella sulfidigena]|uniref:PHP domain-containing protein n=1 Tax=Natroniella sulfidigena TaxID=723921 RepID=UPI00200A9EEB|nr:PHP domain-containing protein [Natroniella sulfidigena]MCK8817192.1 PHP domain-containing protein [Natroniella sulfidigena]
MRLNADYHTHTLYSHGKGTIRENIEVAIAKGLERIAISDHGPACYGFGVRDAATFLEIKKEVDKYDQLYPEIKVLAGVEANVISLDGKLDLPRFILEELDVVLVGLHLPIKPVSWQDGVGIIFNNVIVDKLKLKSKEIRKKNTEALVNAIQNYKIDIITHPGYRINIDTQRLAREAAKRDTALEINASHGYLTEEFVKVAVSENVKFSLGSDAHKPVDVGEVKPALQVAKSAGLSVEDIINVV